MQLRFWNFAQKLHDLRVFFVGSGRHLPVDLDARGCGQVDGENALDQIDGRRFYFKLFELKLMIQKIVDHAIKGDLQIGRVGPPVGHLAAKQIELVNLAIQRLNTSVYLFKCNLQCNNRRVMKYQALRPGSAAIRAIFSSRVFPWLLFGSI